MKILKSDSQCVFRIILVEKLQVVRPNWNKNNLNHLRIKTDLTHFMQIITLLPVSKFYENLHA